METIGLLVLFGVVGTVGAVIGRMSTPAKEFSLDGLRAAAPQLKRLGNQGSDFLDLVLKVSNVQDVSRQQADVRFADNAKNRNEANDNIDGYVKAIANLEAQIGEEEAVVDVTLASDDELNELMDLRSVHAQAQ